MKAVIDSIYLINVVLIGSKNTGRLNKTLRVPNCVDNWEQKSKSDKYANKIETKLDNPRDEYKS